jgi:hypothetical protein
MTRMKEEFEGMKLKSEARLTNTCAMNLRESKSRATSLDKDEEDHKVLAQKQGLSTGSIISTFVVTSGIVYLGMLGI